MTRKVEIIYVTFLHFYFKVLLEDNIFKVHSQYMQVMGPGRFKAVLDQ